MCIHDNRPVLKPVNYVSNTAMYVRGGMGGG